MAKSLADILEESENSVYFAFFRNRLNELEQEMTLYTVYRLRNGEALYTSRDKSAAEDYITENDYNPERVKVSESVSDSDNAEELADLRKFRDAVVAAKGQAYWDGRDKPLYTLLPGTDVIEVRGKKFALLNTTFGF